MSYIQIRYGSSIGTLNVYLFDGTARRLWTLSGNRGNNWFEGQVSYTSSGIHRILVEGIAGKDYLVSVLNYFFFVVVVVVNRC
jgi:hypothetical protein